MFNGIKNHIFTVVGAITMAITAYSQTVQSGKASYYAKRLIGRQTASGERLSLDSFTCAHRNYPFGTRLRVTNVLNGKHVIVRVNDRGPFHKGRIIDLSWGAAKAIGILAQGSAPVTVEKLGELSIPFRPIEDELPVIEFDVADVEMPDSINGSWHQK